MDELRQPSDTPPLVPVFLLADPDFEATVLPCLPLRFHVLHQTPRLQRILYKGRAFRVPKNDKSLLTFRTANREHEGNTTVLKDAHTALQTAKETLRSCSKPFPGPPMTAMTIQQAYNRLPFEEVSHDVAVAKLKALPKLASLRSATFQDSRMPEEDMAQHIRDLLQTLPSEACTHALFITTGDISEATQAALQADDVLNSAQMPVSCLFFSTLRTQKMEAQAARGKSWAPRKLAVTEARHRAFDTLQTVLEVLQALQVPIQSLCRCSTCLHSPCFFEKGREAFDLEKDVQALVT